jgi:hypothetical protein
MRGFLFSGGLALACLVLSARLYAGLLVVVDVDEIGYAWSEDTGYFPYNTLASTMPELGGSPLPGFTADLGIHESVTFRFQAPAGMRFHWNPSDGEGDFFNAEPIPFMGFGQYNGSYFIEDIPTSLTFLNYQGAEPMPLPVYSAAFEDNGSSFMVDTCTCLGTPSVEAYFTGIDLTIDLSAVDRSSWVETVYDADGFFAFLIPFTLDDPGQRLTLVAIPEPAQTFWLFAIAATAVVLVRRRAGFFNKRER